MAPNLLAPDAEVGSKRSNPATQAKGALAQTPPSDENEIHSSDSCCDALEDEENLIGGAVLCKKSSEISKSDANGRSVRRRTSRFCGVCSANRKNQWQARILMLSKVTHLGYFKTEEEAARVYDVVSLSLSKDKANTNFPLSDYTTGEYAERVESLAGLSREDLQKSLGVKPIRKTSRFNGVSKKRGKWVAKVMIDKKLVYHASFHDEREAALAYDGAVRRLKPSKAHAYVNFVEPAAGDIGNLGRMSMVNSKGSIPQMQMMNGGSPHQHMIGAPQHHGMMGVPQGGRIPVPSMPLGSGVPVPPPNSMHVQWPMMGHMPYPMEPLMPPSSGHEQGMMMPGPGMSTGPPRPCHPASMPYPTPDMFEMDMCSPSGESMGLRGKGMPAVDSMWPGSDPSLDWWRNHHQAMGGYPTGNMPPHLVGSSQGLSRSHMAPLGPPQHPMMWDPNMMKGMAPPLPISQHSNPMDAFSRREPLRAHVQGIMQQPHGMMGSMYNERESSSASTWSPFQVPNMGGIQQGEADASFASKRTPIPAWA